jgi:hypothetical protein
LANSILELLGMTTGDEAANLGRALAALAAQVKSGQERRAMLTKIIEMRQAIPCDAAVAQGEKSELLVDMLKWPICTGRDEIMLRVAELQGAQPAEFGEFTKQGIRSTFHGELRNFVIWLKNQRDSNGKPFNIDSPPAWSPIHSH